MSVPIRIKRSAVPGKKPTVDQLQNGELALNFYDGDLYAKRIRPGVGTDIVNLAAGVKVQNVLYVTKDGNDTNTGQKLGDAKLTIKAAVEASQEGTVIRVASGVYEEDNPIKLPPQVSIIGDSLREVTITPKNPEDLFHVSPGNYISDMSFVGESVPGRSICSFDPDNVKYFAQSPYIRNCTNFIPDSIGLKIDGRYAIGPLKSMVLDSFTQYNQGGIGISITNEGYAQLVSLFTIASDIAVYCGSGAACDLTNSNSSFGNYGFVADGVGRLKYTGTIFSPAPAGRDSFVVDLSTPEYDVVDASYDNVTGIVTITTSEPHKFSVGMGVSISDLKFECPFEVGIRTYPSGASGYVFNVRTVAPGRYLDAADSIDANRQEIIDKSLAEIAVQYTGFANTNFYFPGEDQTNSRSRYYDATRLIQKNKQEIIDKSFASLAVGFPTGFILPGGISTSQQRYFDASRLITLNKQEIVDKSLASIAIGFPAGFTFPDDVYPGQQRYYDASRLIALNKQEIVDKSLASIAVGFPSGFAFPTDPIPYDHNRFYDASRLITLNKQEIVDKSLAAVAIAHSDFYFPSDSQTNIRSRYYDAYRLIQNNKDIIVGLAWDAILSTYPDFTYSETKCKRDIGFFIDAVSTDVFTGGNNYSRGFVLQYFEGVNPIGIAASEREPSVYAFQQARDFMKQAITNTLVGAAYSDLTLTPDPDTLSNTDPNSCFNVQSNIDNLVGIVTVSIGAGDTTSLPSSPNYGYFDLSVGIGTTVSPGGVKCARDLGYLIEALATDIFTGGNKYLRDYTLQYFDGATPVGIFNPEREPTVTAFNAVENYARKAITNQLNYKEIGISSGPADYNLGGPNIPVLLSGNPDSCTDVQDAIHSLVGIAVSVIGTGSTSVLSDFTERLGISTTNTCARDLAFAVDALVTDVFTNGNKYSRDFALQYFDENGNLKTYLDGENVQSAYAINTLGEYARKAITNQLNYKNLFVSAGFSTYPNIGEFQGILPSGNPNACADVQFAIGTLAEMMYSAIGSGSTSSLPIQPNLGISTTSKCARDLGFLVEALATDVFTGGNRYCRDYTLQYFDANNSFVFLDGEQEPSVYAFNSLRDYAKKAITNQLNYKEVGIFSGPADYNLGGPNVPILLSGNSDSCTDVQDTIDTLVEIVTSVVSVGNTSSLPSIPNLGISTISLCARDLGHLVDAVSTDVFTGGNKYSRDFTKQYFDETNSLIYLDGENIQSAYSFNVLGQYCKKAVTNQLNYKELHLSVGYSTYPNGGSIQPILLSGNPDSCADVQSNINNLVEIVTNVIGPANIGFLTTFSENTGTFSAGASKCARDLGYIVDAVSNDVREYTNRNILYATKSYFNRSGTSLLDTGLNGEKEESIVAFNAVGEYAKKAINNQLNNKNFSLAIDPATGSNNSPLSCSNVQSNIDNLIGTLTYYIGQEDLTGLPSVSLASTIFSAYVGTSTLPHTYNSGGTVKNNIIRPFDGQVVYLGDLYYTVKKISIVSGGSGYVSQPIVTIDPPDTPWGVPATAVAVVENGTITGFEIVSNGRGYTSTPRVTIYSTDVGINTATATCEIFPTYYSILKSTLPTSSGICTITVNENLPYEVGIGTEVLFFKQSRVLATGHSFEFIGAGTKIPDALPFTGGVLIQENETDARNGGLVVYTSTDQSGNFRIGDGVVVKQNTGTISGTFYSKSLFATVTPFILALGGQ